MRINQVDSGLCLYQLGCWFSETLNQSVTLTPVDSVSLSSHGSPKCTKTKSPPPLSLFFFFYRHLVYPSLVVRMEFYCGAAAQEIRRSVHFTALHCLRGKLMDQPGYMILSFLAPLPRIVDRNSAILSGWEPAGIDRASLTAFQESD